MASGGTPSYSDWINQNQDTVNGAVSNSGQVVQQQPAQAVQAPPAQAVQPQAQSAATTQPQTQEQPSYQAQAQQWIDMGTSGQPMQMQRANTASTLGYGGKVQSEAPNAIGEMQNRTLKERVAKVAKAIMTWGASAAADKKQDQQTADGAKWGGRNV